jgi:hypothetical protein
MGKLAWMLMAAASLPAADGAGDIEKVRDYAVHYTKTLPNYTCTQRVFRTTTKTAVMADFRRPQQDVIEEQVSYVDGREMHKVLKMNGQPPGTGAGADQGMSSRGEFAALLNAIFQPETQTEFRFERTVALNGARVDIFSFRVPQPRGYVLQGRQGKVVVGYRGKLYADAVTAAVVRIEMNCTDIPPNPDYSEVGLTLDYKPTAVAGRRFILPAHYSLHVRNSLAVTEIETDYRAYRRFAADSSITFSEE